MNTLLSGLLTRFGLNSLRQRYITFFIAIAILLMVFAYFGWRYVDNVSHSQIKDIQYRTQAADALADLINQLHSIQINLQQFITIPNNENNQSVDDAFSLFDSSMQKLKVNKWVKNDASLNELVLALGNDRDVLRKQVNELITVRLDKTRWFPAMTIMQERMLQNNMQFKSTLDAMLQESGEDLNSKRKIKIFKLLEDIRYNWQMIISEFRLLVANSFGVFSNDPQEGMQTRRANIDLYASQTDALLKQLEDYSKNSRFDTIYTQNVHDLQDWHAEWINAYHDVLTSFAQEQWRHDLTLLNNNIQPLLKQIEQRISILQLELSVASSKNITLLTHLAQSISDYVIYVALTLIVFGLFGFIIFQRAILSPISTFATVLKAEAIEADTVDRQLLSSSTTEFKQLTDAFNDMRLQVKSRQDHLDHMAHHDSLTHLPNRILLRDRLMLALARAKRDGKTVGLLFLDLDRFKQINDSLGHDIGDKMLQVVAERLQQCVRASDTVARMGGDEFAIVVEGVTNVEQIVHLARKILKAFVPPFMIETHELHSSTSIGIALSPNDDIDVDILIKDADIAMYHAKDLGRGNYKFYSSEMALKVAEHMALESQLRNALNNNELYLQYQPIVDIKTNKIVSTEALLRWRHPNKGVLSPKEFLYVMEDTGLIRPVTQWVLNEASRQYLRHKEAGYPNIRMSVNLSGLLLKGDTILDLIINAVEHAQMDPNGLIVEITEDTLVEDLHGSDEALRTLKGMGIRVALDDFGTGQSSLNHLRLTPIDIVKIDRDFIRDIPNDQNDSDLVDAIIAMAHKLRINVVAEGVETREQLDFLDWHKCDSVQGYYCSHPLDSDDIMDYIVENRKISNI